MRCETNVSLSGLSDDQLYFAFVSGVPGADVEMRSRVNVTKSVSLKYSPDQPRDETGRWTDGGSGGALPVPEWLSPNNLVSATAPHVGLSPKAQEVAARISDIAKVDSTTMAGGGTVTTHTATYTTKDGQEIELRAQELIRPDGGVEGRVSANSAGRGAEENLMEQARSDFSFAHEGFMDYGTNRFHLNDPNGPISEIYHIGSGISGQGIATAMLEFARATASTPVMHARTLTEDGAAFSQSVKSWNEDDHPRDENGRFTEAAASEHGSEAAELIKAELTTELGVPVDFKAAAEDLRERSGIIDGMPSGRQLRNHPIFETMKQEYLSEGLDEQQADMRAEVDMIQAYSYLKNEEDRFYFYDNQESNSTGYVNPDTAAIDRMAADLVAARTEAVEDAMESGEITIAVTPDIFSFVVSDERFMSQFETGESGGVLDPDYRMVQEAASQGVKLDTEDTDRPIYGFVTTSTEQLPRDRSERGKWQESMNVNTDRVSQYGEWRAVLNSDVRDRTTITVGDSLGTDRFAQPINSVASEDVLTNMGVYQPRAWFDTTFIEAQVHGGVSINDIKTLYVPEEDLADAEMIAEQYNLNIDVEKRAY